MFLNILEKTDFKNFWGTIFKKADKLRKLLWHFPAVHY